MKLEIVDGLYKRNSATIGEIPLPHSETFINGIWFPSVSTIIGAQPKPWLESWREKWGSLAVRKMEIAKAIGTAFHDCVEQYLEGKVWCPNTVGYPSCDVRVMCMMRSWVAWAESVDGTIYQTETKVISHKHKYSGTLDAVGKVGKTLLLIDWKTGSAIYGDMDLQLAAYAFAYNEMNKSSGMDIVHKDVKDGLIVHVSKDKPHFKLKTKQFKLGKRVFNKFLNLRELFDDIKEVKHE